MTHYSSIARTFLLCLTTILCATSAFAAKQGGLGFSHNDWELACDNKRTCRAAGYSIEGEELPVSVLLIRKAGAGQPVKATLQIGQYGDNEALDKLPPSFSVTMRINQQTLGTLPLGKDKLQTDLSAAQTDALIAALSHTSDITWSYGKTRWQLSDKGAAAILLKMDEFQGRIGTTGALLKKGKQNEDKVLPPLPPPRHRCSRLAGCTQQRHQTGQQPCLARSPARHDQRQLPGCVCAGSGGLQHRPSQC